MNHAGRNLTICVELFRSFLNIHDLYITNMKLNKIYRISINKHGILPKIQIMQSGMTMGRNLSV